MPVKETKHDYPLIDADPHFKRVVRYMRPEDYVWWAGATAATPGALALWERIDVSSAKPDPRAFRQALKLNGFLGFVGGFLIAYQRSSFRFWGWTENAREEQKDLAELSARARAGQSLYGDSDQSAYIQGVAARNSTWSQLKLNVMPWFNFVNHPHHGVDTSKYYPNGQPPAQPS